MPELIEELNAQDTCKDWYCIYAEYVNSQRSIPGLDGLKSVQRRILMSLNTFAKDKNIKTATVSGHVIGNYHPHGDASVDGAIATMVNSGQLIGKGSWGSYLMENMPAAASRYTELRFTSEQAKYYFELAGSCPTRENELGNTEYVNLPVVIPETLIYGTEGIGVGAACKIPAFTKESLLKALKDNDPRDLEVNVKDLEVLEIERRRLWETGDGAITFAYKVHQEWSKVDNQNVVVIEGNGKFFKPRYLAVFKSWIDEGLIWIRDESSEHIKLVIGKTKNIRKINIEEIEKRAQLCSRKKFRFNIRIWDYRDNKVKAIGMRDWLFACHDEYLKAFNDFIAKKTAVYDSELKLLNLVPKVYPEFMKKEGVKSFKQIAKEYSISEEEVSKISDFPIKYAREEYLSRRRNILESKIAEIKSRKPL